MKKITDIFDLDFTAEEIWEQQYKERNALMELKVKVCLKIEWENMSYKKGFNILVHAIEKMDTELDWEMGIRGMIRKIEETEED